MGKQSRRERNRTPKGPTPGYDENGVALPPGAPGSLFDIFKIDPWIKDGGFYQFVVLPLDPFGNCCNEALQAGDRERYRGFMRSAMGVRSYKQTLAAVHAYESAKEHGMTDAHHIDLHVRTVSGLRLPPYLLEAADKGPPPDV